MVTAPLANPYETRVLHAAPSMRPARRQVAIELHGQDWLEIWDNCIVTRDQTYSLDESFNARVTPDWRAPLTVAAPLGLALRDERGRWNIYIPLEEEQVWRAVSALRDVCEARGLDLPDLEPDALAEDMSPVQGRNPPASMPVRPFTASRSPMAQAPGKHAYASAGARTHAAIAYHPAARAAADAPAAQATIGAPISPSAATMSVGMTSDIVLAAIVHLSVLFLPVILPATVWLALRRTAPWVAGHAREAARYQALVWCLGALLLGGATVAALLHGYAVATVGLLAFITLLAAAGVYAFYAVLRATNGGSFGYLDFMRRAR